MSGNLTITTHALRVATLPGRSVGAADDVVGTVTTHSQAAVLLPRGSESSALAVLVHGLADPVDARVIADRDVIGVHQNDLEVFVGGVLVHPVGVQHAQVGALTANALLRDTAKTAGELQLVNTLVLRLTVHDTLAEWALAATTANSNAVHDVTL